MRLVTTNEILGGEILGRAIIDEDGRILLAKGIRMQLGFLNKLDEKGINELIIDDEISEGIEINSVVSFETKIESKKLIKKEMDRMIKSREISVAELHRVIDLLINDIMANKTGLLNLRDLKLKNDYLFTHTLNVTIMSIIIAQRLEGVYDKVKTVALGALLHDFGKLFLANEILENETNLNTKDMDEYKKHPIIGYNILKDNIEITPISRVIALQHHERIDGSGFPNQIKGNEMHLGSKICSVCDEFDTMLARRDFNNALNTSQSVEYLQSFSGVYFDKEVVNTLLLNFPIYVEGTVVLLNGGRVGIVSKNNKKFLTRPSVRIFYDLKNKKNIKQYEIDLSKELNIIIERELTVNIKELMKGK